MDVPFRVTVIAKGLLIGWSQLAMTCFSLLLVASLLSIIGILSLSHFFLLSMRLTTYSEDRACGEAVEFETPC